MQTFRLHRGDCFKVLKEIPDKSVDLILSDPPYNLANYSTGNMKFSWRSEINNDLAEWDQPDMDPSMLVDDIKRILKPTGNAFLFCSYNLIGDYHKAFDSEFDTFQFMVWHKTNPIPNIRKSSFLNSCELIVCFWNKGHTWNFINQKEMHNFIESPICGGNERIKNPKHPTQKPVSILKKIIEIASNKGDVVLDMFSGLFSTGIAALETERSFIGIEMDKAYFDAGVRRIKDAVANTLFYDNPFKVDVVDHVGKVQDCD